MKLDLKLKIDEEDLAYKGDNPIDTRIAKRNEEAVKDPSLLPQSDLVDGEDNFPIYFMPEVGIGGKKDK